MQKSLTEFVVGFWIVISFFGMLYIGPSAHFVYHIPLVVAYAISAIFSAILSGIFYILPVMLGLGVLLYRTQWKKAETRSIVLQASIYESYLITLVRPFLLQTMLLIPGLVIVGYVLDNGHLSGVISVSLPVFYRYLITFVLSAFIRIGLEFFEQWQTKRKIKNQKPHSDVGKKY